MVNRHQFLRRYYRYRHRHQCRSFNYSICRKLSDRYRFIPHDTNARCNWQRRHNKLQSWSVLRLTLNVFKLGMERVLFKEKNSLASSLALKNTASGNVYPTKVMGIATLFFFRRLNRPRTYCIGARTRTNWPSFDVTAPDAPEGRIGSEFRRLLSFQRRLTEKLS